MTTFLDTRVVPPAARPDYWSAGIAERFFPMETRPLGHRPFHARLTGGDLGPVAVHRIHGTPHGVERTRNMVSASDPEYLLLYLLRDGVARMEQEGQLCELLPGDMAIQDTSRPSSIHTESGFDLLVASMPRWLIGSRADAVAREAALRIKGDSPFGRIAGPFLQLLATAAAKGEVTGSDADSAAEMLLSALGALAGGGRARVGSPAQTLLTRMQQYALARLHDPELGPGQLAQAHFVSTRYVHKLFATTGTGVSAWIREQRLERALAELRRSDGVPVSVIAAKWGYRDAASFSRAFRQRFGMSPREARNSSESGA